MLKHWIQQLGHWIASRGRFSLRSLGLAHAAEKPEKLGPAGERLAERFLKSQGYRILARGYRLRQGEIDLIALDGKCIVFVEVKTWTVDSGGDPSQAVDRRKQQRISRTAQIYLKAHHLLDHPARFDVVSIVWPQDSQKPKLRHFRAAFEAC